MLINEAIVANVPADTSDISDGELLDSDDGQMTMLVLVVTLLEMLSE